MAVSATTTAAIVAATLPVTLFVAVAAIVRAATLAVGAIGGVPALTASGPVIGEDTVGIGRHAI